MTFPYCACEFVKESSDSCRDPNKLLREHKAEDLCNIHMLTATCNGILHLVLQFKSLLVQHRGILFQPMLDASKPNPSALALD